MSRHTTFGIGGAADCFVMPETIEELQKVIVEVTKANVPFFILGGGANLLMALMIIVGIWYPAYKAMQLQPAEALHDE